MGLPENISDAFASCVAFQRVLEEIARGKPAGGAPLGGQTAQQLARQVLIERGRSWPKKDF